MGYSDHTLEMSAYPCSCKSWGCKRTGGYIKGPLSSTPPRFTHSEGTSGGVGPSSPGAAPAPRPAPAPSPTGGAIACTAAHLQSGLIQDRRRSPSCSCRRRDGMSATGMYECPYGSDTLVIKGDDSLGGTVPVGSHSCTGADLWQVQERRRQPSCSCR